ncbi:hypothetical protein [Carnobacterium maltaromaticum]|uniref:hypothetical protein n=1 Tax=Carnobacterium maltaromaticum TaxID=2751 RepID=UPI00165C0A5F|nr:hypothetical protein [Carnobacterium maltaromaticum]MBC9808726.1 hypothetical protein [Carnobacterium maltaromaticum]
MTNKLEEVFKELQESHVLVDREEYEKLVEKAKEIEAEEVVLKVGGYYFKENTIYKINKLGAMSDLISAYTEPSHFVKNLAVKIVGAFLINLRKATDEEIKLFKRAEMYHKHGRKLDELKVGDFIKIGKGIYQMKNETTGFIQSIIEGRHELYLTFEEAQEAHKKIVGE